MDVAGTDLGLVGARDLLPEPWAGKAWGLSLSGPQQEAISLPVQEQSRLLETRLRLPPSPGGRPHSQCSAGSTLPLSEPRLNSNRPLARAWHPWACVALSLGTSCSKPSDLPPSPGHHLSSKSASHWLGFPRVTARGGSRLGQRLPWTMAGAGGLGCLGNFHQGSPRRPHTGGPREGQLLPM